MVQEQRSEGDSSSGESTDPYCTYAILGLQVNDSRQKGCIVS